MEKIFYIVPSILLIFCLPRLILVLLSRLTGTMAAVKGAPVEVLHSLEPQVKFWAGGLLFWMLGLWISYVAYLIFEASFFRLIVAIFGILSAVTFIMFIIDIRRRI